MRACSVDPFAIQGSRKNAVRRLRQSCVFVLDVADKAGSCRFQEIQTANTGAHLHIVVTDGNARRTHFPARALETVIVLAAADGNASPEMLLNLDARRCDRRSGQ